MKSPFSLLPLTADAIDRSIMQYLRQKWIK